MPEGEAGMETGERCADGRRTTAGRASGSRGIKGATGITGATGVNGANAITRSGAATPGGRRGGPLGGRHGGQATRRWLLLAPLAALPLAGCSHSPVLVGAPQPLLTPEQLEQSLRPYLDPAVVATYQGKSGTDQTDYRDQVIHARIALIDSRFKVFLTDLGVDTKTLAIGADLAVIGLNTGSVLSGGETAKDILSGLAAAVTGAKGAVDKNAFYDQTAPTLVSQMIASRREVLAGILAKMQTPNYSLVEALVDLESYEFAGSFNGALQQIGQKAGNQFQVAEARIQQLASTRLQAADIAPDQIESREVLRRRILALGGPQVIAAAGVAAKEPVFQSTVEQAVRAGADPATEAGARTILLLLVGEAFDSTGTLARLQGVVDGVAGP